MSVDRDQRLIGARIIARRSLLKTWGTISAVVMTSPALAVVEPRSTALTILPLDQVPDPEFARIARRAKALLDQMTSGLNYFGQPKNFVYQLSLDEFQRGIDATLVLASNVSTSFAQYSTEQQFLENTENALRTAIQHTNALKQKQTDQLESSNQNIKALQTLIIQMRTDIDSSYLDVMAEQTNFLDAVRRATTPTCTVATVLTVVSAIASIAGGISAFATAATAAFNAINDHGLALQNVAKTVQTFKTAGSDAVEIYNAYRQIETQLASKPDSAKIVLDDGDVDKMIDKFDRELQASPAANTQEASAFHDAVHRYVDLVKSRNQKILDRDNLIGARDALIGELANRDSEIQNFTDQLADSTRRDHQDFIIRLGAVFQKNVESVQLSIWEEIRALELFTLKDLTTSYSISTSGQDAAKSLTFLTTMHAQIKQDYLASEVGLPGASDDLAPQSVTVTLTHNQRHTLSTRTAAGTYNISFPISLMDFPPELAEVFASKVTILLLDSNGRPVRFGGLLIHSGYATFKRIDGEVWVFTHMPRSSPVQMSGDGKVSLGFAEAKYVGLSPFTSWSLRVREVEQNRSIADIVAIRMTFEGKCRGSI